MIHGGRHGGRRAGKVEALRRWEAEVRRSGEHAHVLYPDRSECLNGDCEPCPEPGCHKLRGHGGGDH